MAKPRLPAALAVGLTLAGSSTAALAQNAEPAWQGRASFRVEQLVSSVLARNPGGAARRAALEAARHRVAPAGALDDARLRYLMAPRTFGGERGLNQQVEFSQDLPWPGTRAARQSAASHRAEAADHAARALELDLAAAARVAFAELYFVQRATAIHHARDALLSELEAAAQARYRAGRSTQRDVLQARLAIAELDRHLLELARAEAVAVAHVNGLLNRSPTAPLPAPETLPLPAIAPSLEQLEARLPGAHPDLARLDAEVAAREDEVRLAGLAFRPDLRFLAGYNGMLDLPDKRPAIGVSLNLPLDRDKRRDARNAARAEVRRARADRADAAARLLAELGGVHALAVEALDSLALHERTLLPLAAQFLDLALADYRSGSGDFPTVVTAEQRKLTIEENLERARADAFRHLAEIERRAGGTR